MSLFLLTNLNNKFVAAYEATNIEAVVDRLSQDRPEAGFRQIGANTWQIGIPAPDGLLRPVQYLFKPDVRSIPSTVVQLREVA